MSLRPQSVALAPVLLLGACAVQPAYQRPALAAPQSWSDVAANATPVTGERWWSALDDPAIDALVDAALRDNPTLAEAAARIDRARALVSVRRAAQWPDIGLVGNAARTVDRMGPGTDTIGQTAAGLGLSLAWEIDLWGRVREGRAAARSRMAARIVEAEGARLSLVADIADTVLALRLCDVSLAIRDGDIASRETELAISRARLSLGSIAPAAVAASQSSLATAATERIVQAGTCRALRNALVALSGLGLEAIHDLLPEGAGNLVPADPLPAPPPFVPALPALMLVRHPAVMAAEREVAARWSEIGTARAERLPRLDLTAALTGQWLRALGSTSTYASRSVGLGLTMPLFDGGAGAANVRGAEAAYREALAQLVLAVRAAIRDTEDGLSAQQSALARGETARTALIAAEVSIRANEARWRAGAIARYELEESRREFRRAQENVALAAVDRARAWVALVRRTGAPLDLSASIPG